MKIQLAQINPVVGDIDANFLLIRNILLGARERKVDLLIFPELALSGYPPRDLLERKRFGQRSMDALTRLARLCKKNLKALIGLAEPNDLAEGKPFYNTAALVGDGGILAIYRKILLPSYDVFDETRWFEPGNSPCVFEAGGLPLGVTICEDIWGDVLQGEKRTYHVDPVYLAVKKGARFIINMSASPFTLKKRHLRREICVEAAKKHGVPIIYCNQVGGNDDLIFDGASFALDSTGRIMAQAKSFEEDIASVEVDEKSIRGVVEATESRETAILWKALSLGLSDYVRKCNQNMVWIGLSGGIDSAVVAALAAQALGPRQVTCVTMPSRFSSDECRRDALKTADYLGVKILDIPIEPVFSQMLETLSPHFGDLAFDVAEENIQARLRGMTLMALSNKFGGLVLATGNKSELATGYCTLYGDMVGALAPIGDVYKTQVYELGRFLNRDREVIPATVLERTPTAELRPGQTDQDTLPPYETLDRVLSMYIEEELGLSSIEKRGIPKDLAISVLEMLRHAEYKRQQAAMVLKVSEKAFGFGRRYPIAQNYREDPDEDTLIP
jgi:NAD+ synthase (glutamine-hydrolysing)